MSLFASVPGYDGADSTLADTALRGVVGVDLIGANVGHAPSCQLASYVTGTGIVPAPASFWRDHPSAVRIDQSPSSTEWDATADVDDYERGAVTLSELAPRAKERMAAFASGKRPGQRRPLVYMSASNVTPVVNALISGGVTSGVGLWVANWNLSEAQAFAEVMDASGPFPIEAVQFDSGEFWDTDVFCTAWLAAVSATKHPSGPVAHFVSKGQTLGELAASRNMSPIEWLVMQQHWHPDNAEKLVADAVAQTGDKWYTAH